MQEFDFDAIELIYENSDVLRINKEDIASIHLSEIREGADIERGRLSEYEYIKRGLITLSETFSGQLETDLRISAVILLNEGIDVKEYVVFTNKQFLYTDYSKIHIDINYYR